MPEVRMYCTAICPYCTRAERLLKNKGVDVEKIRVDADPSLWQEMEEITGRHTVPQIFVGDVHVGGYDDMAELDYQGKLDPLLSGELTQL